MQITTEEMENANAVRVTGPHAGYDRYGRLDHYYWRCEECGHERTDPKMCEGCPRCGAEDA